MSRRGPVPVLVVTLVAASCAPAPAPDLPGGPVEPAEVWVDPSFGDPGHFLLAQATDWRETALIWFDTQLLHSATSYAEVAAGLADRPRGETRARVLGRLRAIADRSWRAARPVVDSLVAAGAVVDCRPLWIVNGASCTLERTADPAVLAHVPGVRRVFRGMPNRAFPRPDVVGPRFVPTPVAAPFDPSTAHVPWNLEVLGVPELWAEGLTGEGVRLVVHDGGFNLGAAPVRSALWRNPGELPGNGVDDDGNGYADDVHGFQFDAGTPDVNRAAVARGQLVHGTAVAALAVGGHTTDTRVQLGVAPDARWAAVMAVRNFDQALEWALLEDFDIYTMSFSYPGLGATRAHFRKMLEHAALAGLFLVSGAGNFGDPESPAFAPIPVQLRTPEDVPFAVLAVAGVDRTRTRPAFSSRGPVEWATLDYPSESAPKPDLTTVNADIAVPDVDGAEATATFRGNSFAAPHLAGVIALLLQADRDVSPWTLRRVLMDTAVDLGEPGAEDGTGAGLVDGPAALRRLRERD